MRLLLAEDEKELANALAAVLKHNNYSIDVVYNGADAYDWAQVAEYDGIIPVSYTHLTLPTNSLV